MVFYVLLIRSFYFIENYIDEEECVWFVMKTYQMKKGQERYDTECF